jgi:serine/threonine protein kinase
MADSKTYWEPEDFGPYVIHERIGVGGMATVHRAIERDSGKQVALKRLLPQLARDPGAVRQFSREAAIAKLLVHPNIVGVEEYGKVGRERYLAMEYVEGQSLLSLLRQANEQAILAPVGVALRVIYKILHALDFAMTGLDPEGKPFNVVHRDLSPSNVILTKKGDVKLIDFGVAKSLRGRYATNSGRIKGKLGYMSPEALAGRQVDDRSDIYSTAIVAWELLTAQRLFRGSEADQLELRASRYELTPPSKINRWVTPELDNLLHVALAEDPDERWPSAGSMLEALVPIVREQRQGSSREALARWAKQLAIGRGVLDSSKTNHHVRPPVAPIAPVMPVMPVAKTDLPGVRKFADAATIIDAQFDPKERHRQMSQSDLEEPQVEPKLAKGSSEFQVKGDVGFDDPIETRPSGPPEGLNTDNQGTYNWALEGNPLE